jgi:hypothetical protein
VAGEEEDARLTAMYLRERSIWSNRRVSGGDKSSRTSVQVTIAPREIGWNQQQLLCAHFALACTYAATSDPDVIAMVIAMPFRLDVSTWWQEKSEPPKSATRREMLSIKLVMLVSGADVVGLRKTCTKTALTALG